MFETGSVGLAETQLFFFFTPYLKKKKKKKKKIAHQQGHPVPLSNQFAVFTTQSLSHLLGHSLVAFKLCIVSKYVSVTYNLFDVCMFIQVNYPCAQWSGKGI